MDLPIQASQFVLDTQADTSVSSDRLRAVCEATRSGLTLVDLVKSLKDYLIAQDGQTRSRATLLLARVRTAAAEAPPVMQPCGCVCNF